MGITSTIRSASRFHAVFDSTDAETISDQDLSYIYDGRWEPHRDDHERCDSRVTANAMNQYTQAGDVVYEYDKTAT